MKDEVERSGASFVLVAGDVFDSSQATKATVSAACAALPALIWTFGRIKPMRITPGFLGLELLAMFVAFEVFGELAFVAALLVG